MYLRYYFLKNVITGEKKELITDNPAFGEIGDRVGNYIIEDYAEEWSDLEEPEDF